MHRATRGGCQRGRAQAHRAREMAHDRGTWLRASSTAATRPGRPGLLRRSQALSMLSGLPAHLDHHQLSGRCQSLCDIKSARFTGQPPSHTSRLQA